MISNKKLFFLTILIVFITSLSLVSATSTNDTTDLQITGNVPSSAVDAQVQYTQQEIKTIGKTTQNATKQAGIVTNYDDLSKKLTDSTESEVEVSLDGEDIYTITEPITLNKAIKNLKIEGNGKTINGNKQKSFLVINHTCDLVLNNLIIANCYFTGDTGGVITLNSSGNVEINDAYFINNNASKANIIYYENNNHSSNLIIKNTTFDSNGYKEYNGDQTSEILNILSDGKVTIVGSKFNSNKAIRAGAMRYQKLTQDNRLDNLIINSTTFYSNVAEEESSALTVINSTNLTIINSNFEMNGDPVAVKLNLSCGEALIENTNFTLNRNMENGGAIDILSNSSIIIKNSNFIKNDGMENGGAIYYLGLDGSNFGIINSTFVSNGLCRSYYPTQHGGAVCIESNGTSYIENSDFDSNAVESCGGAVYYKGIKESKFTINNSRFDYNGKKSDFSTRWGGAVYIDSESDILINNSIFTNNIIGNKYDKDYHGSGAAVYYNNTNEESTFTVNNCTFDSNGDVGESENTYSAGGLYVNTRGNTLINNSKFINNKAYHSGALYYQNDNEKSNIIINNTLFDSNGLREYSQDLITEINTLPAANTITINTTGNASIFASSFKNNNGYVLGTAYIESNGLLIENSTFAYNKQDTTIQNDGCGNGPTLIIYSENATINGTKFINNVAETGSAISYGGNDDCILIINNTLFDSNIGNFGGVLSLDGGTVHIINTDFTNNSLILRNGIINGLGTLISADETNLTINNTNFTSNGLTEKLNQAFLSNEWEMGSFIYYNALNSHFVIDNSNFIKNNVPVISGGLIGFNGAMSKSYYDENRIKHYYYTTNSSLTINNTSFMDNTFVTPSASSLNSEGYVISAGGPTKIDNSIFINNKLNLDNVVIEPDYNFLTGIIYAYPDNSNVSCNVTNSVFVENNIPNFIIKDNQIVLNNVPYNSEDDLEIMDDYYIPNYGDVLIYLDESDDGTLYKINSTSDISQWGTEYLTSVYVEDFKVNEENYLIRMVVNQTEHSQYYNMQIFKNNTYYFIIPHEYTISVDRITPVKIGDNITIRGKVYFTNSTGDEITLKNKPVDLYINGTYIDTVNINDKGEYEFNYTGNVLGTHNVTVVFNKTIYLPRLENTTTFEVIKRDTLINITSTPTALGEETTITIKVTDAEGNIIPEADITFYVDDVKVLNTTDENGIITYKTTISDAGNNYVVANFDGDYGHNSAINSTVFHIDKVNTTITVNAENVTLGNEVIISGILKDKNGKILPNVPIILFVDNEEIDLTTNPDGTYNYTYKTVNSGENYVEVVYEGNDTYNDAINTVNFNVTKIPEAKLDINTKNTTETNVEIEVTVTDEDKKALPDQEVEVTLPDGTKVTKKTDKDGKVTVTDTTTKPGTYPVTAKVASTNKVTGTNATKNITVTQDYQKIIDEQNKKIDNLTQKVDNQTKQIDNQDKKINNLEDTIDTKNRTSNIKVVPDNGTVEDNSVVVSLDDQLGQPISNALIKVTNSNGEVIGNATTDKNGVAVIPVDTRAGVENITVSYAGSKDKTPVNTTISVTTYKNNVTVTVDPVEGIVGENIILTTHVTDVNGNPISGGNVVFKLNGKTLRIDGRFDSKAEAQKFKVENGLVTVTIKADLYLRNAKNLTASYSGSYKYNEAKSDVVTAQIKKRNAELTVSVSPQKQKQYNKITFTATLKDTTKNAKNTTAINQNTKVIFKVNGKTIKDKNGKNLQVKVVNNTAQYTYTVPQGMGGIAKDGSTRKYEVTAVLVSDTFYPDTKGESYFNVERSPTTINIEKVTVNKNNQLSVNAKLTDYKGKNLIGTNNVNIKINGKTYVNPKTNKTENFRVTDGKIDLSNIQINKNTQIKKVQLVTGARQAYRGQRTETTNIVKV